MPDNTPALVVVAAGGLGTRVHGWARFIPKEFYPVGGRPGIARLLEEIAARSARPRGGHRLPPLLRAVRRLGPPGAQPQRPLPLRPRGRDWRSRPPSPRALTRHPHPAARPLRRPDLRLQRRRPPRRPGRACTSRSPTTSTRGPARLQLLRDAGDVAVARQHLPPRARAQSGASSSPARQPTGNRGRSGPWSRSPDPAQARALEEQHGTAEPALCSEGRARLTAPFIRFARDRQHAAPRSEPKLALALGAYAREHQVVAVAR